MGYIENWLKYLETVSKRVRHHHDALWEEVKHYSWWVYLLLAGTVWVFASNLAPCDKTMIIAIASFFGIYLSVAAIITIRRERLFFSRWVEIQNDIEKSLRDESKIDKNALPFESFPTDTPGIRIYRIFQFTFGVTGIIFIVILAIQVYRFMCVSKPV